MRSTRSWLDTGTSTLVAATRHVISTAAVGIFVVAGLTLGSATMAAAWDMLPKTGQTTCYKLDRYPPTTDPATQVSTPGDIILTDIKGVTDFDASGVNPTPVCGDPGAPPDTCFDPTTATFTDRVVPCAGTGQDGELQTGYTLTRIDKGDGRIYDNNTGLTWAKKSDDGGLHDKDNIYTWDQAFTDYIHVMNNSCHLSQIGAGPPIACATDADCVAAGGGKCGFAGKRDWRLPNVRELGSIVNWGVFTNPMSPSPAIWPEFNSNCVRDATPPITVLTGSCTHSDDVTNDENNDPLPFGTLTEPDPVTGEQVRLGLRVPMTYWSSTSGDAPGDAWFVDFFTGDSGAHFKEVDLDVDPQAVNPADPPSPANTEVIFAGHARAVRGPGDDDPAPKPAPASRPPKKKR